MRGGTLWGLGVGLIIRFFFDDVGEAGVDIFGDFIIIPDLAVPDT